MLLYSVQQFGSPYKIVFREVNAPEPYLLIYGESDTPDSHRKATAILT